MCIKVMVMTKDILDISHEIERDRKRATLLLLGWRECSRWGQMVELWERAPSAPYSLGLDAAYDLAMLEATGSNSLTDSKGDNDERQQDNAQET